MIKDYSKLRDINFKFNFNTINRKGFTKRIVDCENIMAFDIETSNGFYDKTTNEVIGFSHEQYNNDLNNIINGKQKQTIYDDKEPISIMYIWQFAIEDKNGKIFTFYGRTWQELKEFCIELDKNIAYAKNRIPRNEKTFATNVDLKYGCEYYVYIHNLSFEFQHLRNVFDHAFSGNVFAREERKPMNAKIQLENSKNTLIFKDSLSLTQKSLDAWCKDANLPVKKLKEDKDFYLPIRTPITELEPEVYKYCENDVVSMIYGIRQYRQKYNNMYNIPLTQTGCVRRVCESKVGVDDKWTELCRQVTATYTLDRFNDLHSLFGGGWTHANAIYVGKVLHDVKCFDLRSDYPSQMCTKKFPIGAWEDATPQELEKGLSEPLKRDYCYYIHVRLKNVYSACFNTFWSSSKVENIKGEKIDNGKILSCEEVEIIMTDLDWLTFKQAYDFTDVEYLRVYKSKFGYLPEVLIRAILDYYNFKTTLKNVEGRESEYNESKQFINSIYGVSVTKLVMPIIAYSEGWTKTPITKAQFDKEIQNKVSSDKPVWLTYQIGCWVTAWARYTLWQAILYMDERVVYGDTDSIKGVFNDDDMLWVEQFNNNILKDASEVCKFYNMPLELFTPKTPKGDCKELGFFDREDDCTDFKTLGAKRYVTKEWNAKKEQYEIHTTIAGLPKKAGTSKISNVEDFVPGTIWNSKESLKLTSTYNDNQPSKQIWKDLNGVEYISSDKFGINLRPTTFDLELGDEFEKFIELLSGFTSLEQVPSRI